MSKTTSTCQIHKKYTEIKCANTSLPKDPDGLCILHSHNKEKNPEAFREAMLAKWNQADEEICDFRGVFFPGPVSLPFDIFEKYMDFSRATFKAKAIFFEVYFTKGASFSEASFADLANFASASFMRADFSDASFTEGADFSGASFGARANFSRVSFGGRVLFLKINRPRNEGQSPQPLWGDFSYLHFQENGMLRFQDMSLAGVTFVGTDLRRLEFYHVDWYHLRGGRQALYDEVLLRKKELSFVNKILIFFELMSAPKRPPPTKDDYGEVERLYRNLEVNYESVNDYKTSGDFHYGEMEMHRRASKWRWFPLYWYNLYWISSGYGERPLRAVLTLVGVLLVFSGFFWGVERESLGDWNWSGFWQAFLYVFQQGTLQKPDWLKPVTAGGKFLSALMPILIPGQTALFLLALRNRLGRRR
jgi:uncharacterized protein YjbI with pentapeptide repeats